MRALYAYPVLLLLCAAVAVGAVCDVEGYEACFNAAMVVPFETVSQCANLERMLRDTLWCMEEHGCCAMLEMSGGQMLEPPQFPGGSTCENWPALTCG
eukprot:3935111-Rhodomonas_salina.2